MKSKNNHREKIYCFSYPIPETCQYCDGKVELVSNKLVYGREYGNGKCYLCLKCGSYVGVHSDLKTPLGILANKELRTLRKTAHKLFDSLWKNREMPRDDAYRILANKLNIPTNECHFGWFDKDTAQKAIKAINILREETKLSI